MKVLWRCGKQKQRSVRRVEQKMARTEEKTTSTIIKVSSESRVEETLRDFLQIMFPFGTFFKKETKAVLNFIVT